MGSTVFNFFVKSLLKPKTTNNLTLYLTRSRKLTEHRCSKVYLLLRLCVLLSHLLHYFLHRTMDVLISLNNGTSFISSAYTITASTCVSEILSRSTNNSS